MRLPRVRFTVRRMMAIVVIAGLLMAGWEYCRHNRLKRLSQAYRLRATAHRQEEAVYLRSHRALSVDLLSSISRRSFVEVAGTEVILGQTDASLDLLRKAIESESRWVEYHGAMGTKYERAARAPWLPVDPDPPEP